MSLRTHTVHVQIIMEV